MRFKVLQLKWQLFSSTNPRIVNKGVKHYWRIPHYNKSKSLSCSVLLQKLHVFLFQDVLVITRAITQNEQLWYQLYRQPIPVRDLEWEDLQDGEMRVGGSIRGAFSNNERSESHINPGSNFKWQKWLRNLKCVFKVLFHFIYT